MYMEARPTSVTVIGWAWIVIGGLMVFAGVMALFAAAMMDNMLAADPKVDVPFVLRVFPLIAAAQLGIAIVGIVSGTFLLKRRAWARKVLEVLSWIAVISLVVFVVIWSAMWLTMTVDAEVGGFAAMGIVMAVGITAVYGVPFAIMIKYLRSEKVRSAMQAAG